MCSFFLRRSALNPRLEANVAKHLRFSCTLDLQRQYSHMHIYDSDEAKEFA